MFVVKSISVNVAFVGRGHDRDIGWLDYELKEGQDFDAVDAALAQFLQAEPAPPAGPAEAAPAGVGHAQGEVAQGPGQQQLAGRTSAHGLHQQHPTQRAAATAGTRTSARSGGR